MCYNHLFNWPINLLLISNFHKPESFLSINHLAIRRLYFNKKGSFVTFQSSDNSTYVIEQTFMLGIIKTKT